MPRPVGEETGKDMRSDPNAYDESKLLDSISKNLSEVDGLDAEPEDDSTPVIDDDPADDDDSTPPMPTAKKAADDSDSTPADSDDKPADEDSGDDDKPAIPDNYYRAAVHAEWTPEEIKELYDADPKLALKTLKRVFDDTNRVSQVFAEKGRLAAAQNQSQSQSQSQSQNQQLPATAPAIDMEKLKAQYEDDPFGAIAKLIEAKNQPQPLQVVPQQPVQVANEQGSFQERLAVFNEVTGFFKDKDMSDYEDFYGDDQNNLTPGQYANRNAVTAQADLIMDGMELAGRKISVKDALTRAHFSISAPVTEKIVRNKLVKSAKKREKGMTLRSSKTKTPKVTLKRGSKSDEQRETDTQARLDAMSI